MDEGEPEGDVGQISPDLRNIPATTRGRAPAMLFQ
jgi:hypothetical protein